MGVSQVVADRGQACAVRVHPHGHPAYPEASVRALLADCLAVPVVATGEEVAPVLRLQVCPAVAEAKVPLAAGTAHYGVQGMVVPFLLKAREENLALVYLGVELRIAVHVGVDDYVRSGGQHDFVVEHRQSERRVAGLGFGNENVRFVRLAVAVGVGHHDDGLAIRHPWSLVVVDALGQPDAALWVDVHRDRRKEQGRLGPHFQLEVLAQFRVQLERRQRNLFQGAFLFAERFTVGQLGVSHGKRQRSTDD